MRALLILVLFVACKANQIPQAEDAVIIMKKTPCFGTCPVYEITIFNDKQVTLEAEQHLELEGNFRSELSETQYKALITKFEKSDFYSFENEYTSNITDLPTTFLTFRSAKGEKKIMDYHGAPEELKILEREVHQLVETLEWEEVKE